MSKNILERNQIDDKYKWDLSLMFKNVEEWTSEFNEAEREVPKLIDFKGKLGTFEGLKGYLDLTEKLDRKITKLYIYSFLRKDEDNRVTENISYYDKASSLFNYKAEHESYFEPEMLELSMEYVDEFIAKYPEFAPHRIHFVDLFESKKHILSKEKEEMLSVVGEVFQYPESIANLLTDSDMTFAPIIDKEGNKITVTEGNYSLLLEDEDREIRRQAYESIMGGYKQFEATLGKTLTASMKTFNLQARFRNYESFLNLELDPQRIPKEVFTNTINVVNENLSLMHRYYGLKKKVLGLDKMYAYDTYAPITKEDDNCNIEYVDAIDMIKDAVSVLGKDYIAKLENIVDKRIIDVYPNAGKGTGAYSYSSYDAEPYILTNYNKKLDDVSTLAHELGHSINGLYINENQPYTLSGTTLFCAEVASTVNEILLAKHILSTVEDKDIKIKTLVGFIQTIIGTVFRQVMYSEFEHEIHERLSNKEALTGSDLSKVWLNLNNKYNGSDVESLQSTEIGWARIPHFYRDFYVYKYATGFSAAAQFANSILNKEDGAVENYIRFLSSGTSNYPIQTLQSCNVDLTSKKPIEAVAKLLEDLIGQFEDLLSVNA